MKIVKGYVSSEEINGSFIPQKLQNLLLRDYCSKNKLNLNLSSTEYENSNLMLFSLIDEIDKLNGIVFFSIFQLPKIKKTRFELFKKIINKKKILYFALESITLKKNSDIQEIEYIYKINFLKNNNVNKKSIKTL